MLDTSRHRASQHVLHGRRAPWGVTTLKGSTVVWILRLCPGRMGGMWIFNPGGRVGPPAGRVFATRSIALCIESSFEVASTNMEDGLSGIVPHSISRMDL